jgi:hypothetical protein
MTHSPAADWALRWLIWLLAAALLGLVEALVRARRLRVGPARHGASWALRKRRL